MLTLPILILLAFIPHFFFVLRQGMASTDELAEAKKRGEDIESVSIPFWPNVAFQMIILGNAHNN
jgi:quinol-cytochrome oxidoreductase complex cytochrome b subunit